MVLNEADEVKSPKSSFFHRKVASQCAKNKILSLYTEEYEQVTNCETVKKMAMKYYKDLFSASGRTVDRKKLKEIVTNSLTEWQIQSLIAPITTEEIKRKAVFSMRECKALGPFCFFGK